MDCLKRLKVLKAVELFGLITEKDLKVMSEMLSPVRINTHPFSSISRPTMSMNKRSYTWEINCKEWLCTVDTSRNILNLSFWTLELCFFCKWSWKKTWTEHSKYGHLVIRSKDNWVLECPLIWERSIKPGHKMVIDIKAAIL